MYVKKTSAFPDPPKIVPAFGLVSLAPSSPVRRPPGGALPNLDSSEKKDS